MLFSILIVSMRTICRKPVNLLIWIACMQTHIHCCVSLNWSTVYVRINDVAQKTGPTIRLTGKTVLLFSHICSSVMSDLNSTKFTGSLCKGGNSPYLKKIPAKIQVKRHQCFFFLFSNWTKITVTCKWILWFSRYLKHFWKPKGKYQHKIWNESNEHPWGYKQFYKQNNARCYLISTGPHWLEVERSEGYYVIQDCESPNP